MSSPASQPTKTIRQLRQARGWSQIDLAVRIGVDRSNVTRWESGAKTPSPGNRQRLAKLFGVEVGEIAFGQDEERL